MESTPSQNVRNLSRSSRRAAILTLVQTQSAVRQSSPDAGFAGLLAALTAPKPEPRPERIQEPVWTDGLEDDVATLSYERALRHHARYKPAAEPLDSVARAEAPVSAAASQPGAAAVSAAPETKIEKELRAARDRAAAIEQTRKRASVTLRMSRSEFAQLQQRAAEAGLSVSAYVRSCTFEAESLRAQVKQALAELRAAKSNGNVAPAPRFRFLWFWHARR